MKKANSVRPDFIKSNIESLRTLQSEVQSNSNLHSLSGSQMFETSINRTNGIDERRIKEERTRRILEK